MRFDITQNTPALGGGYVPDSLVAEHYQRYLQPEGWQPEQSTEPLSSTYDFSSDLLHPSRQTEFRQTVEQIVSRGYFAVPWGRPETALISDKKHTFAMGLEGMVRQIRQRYEIFESNLYEIERSKCSAINSLFRREAELGFIPRTGREVDSLNKNLQSLYQQQRDERVALWKDVSRLKGSLPEAAQQYLASYRKVSILEDEKDEGGELR